MRSLSVSLDGLKEEEEKAKDRSTLSSTDFLAHGGRRALVRFGMAADSECNFRVSHSLRALEGAPANSHIPASVNCDGTDCYQANLDVNAQTRVVTLK